MHVFILKMFFDFFFSFSSEGAAVRFAGRSPTLWAQRLRVLVPVSEGSWVEKGCLFHSHSQTLTFKATWRTHLPGIFKFPIYLYVCMVGCEHS